MLTFQDLERGSPIKVRWPGTTDTAVGLIDRLPANLTDQVFVKIDGKVRQFDQADTTAPDALFPPLPDYTTWTPDTPIYYRQDDGTVVDGRLVRPPANPISGFAMFIPLGETEAIRVPVYRLQSDPSDYNPFRLSFDGKFLTHEGRLLTYGA